ncbi:MAG TPA: hypothetical protein VI322_03620, partial [Candidatus Saccharimonadia bacterium]
MSTISTLPARVMGSQPVAPLVRLFERALLAAGSLLIRLLAPPLKRRATNDLVERALDERFPAAPNPRAAEMTGGLTIYPNGVLTPMEKRTTEPATPAALAKIWVPNKQEPLGAWFDLTPRSLVLLFRAMARVAGV